VIERSAFGGQAATTQWLDNVPGFSEGISGADFSKQIHLQSERFGVELLQAQDVASIHSPANYHCVTTEDGSEYSARALVIATGSRYKQLEVPGEEEYIGAGIHFCATCDGPFYKGLSVAVVGGGNSATEESLFLTKFAEHITLLVRGDALTASQILKEKVLSHPKIDVRFNTEVLEFRGQDSKLKSILIHDNLNDDTKEITPSGAFIFIGQTPNTKFLQESDIFTNEWGFIISGHALVHNRNRPPGYENRNPYVLETSVPGIFVAGDVRAGSTKQVASAAGEGVTAALLVREYLKFV
jgi:thioredoxin reductase (NADPH)